jgi:hypothetical protein
MILIHNRMHSIKKIIITFARSLVHSLSFSLEVGSCAATPEVPNILYSEFRCDHKSGLLVPILNHMNPVYNLILLLYDSL